MVAHVSLVIGIMFFFYSRVAARSYAEGANAERKMICDILERESENAFTEYRKQANRQMRDKKVIEHWETAMGIYNRLFSQYFKNNAK